MSNDCQEYCREIDRVTVKGSLLPLGFFTVDIDLDRIEPGKFRNKIQK